MSSSTPRERRLLVGIAAGGLLGGALLKQLAWGLAVAGLALVVAAWRAWEGRRFGARVLRGLRARWLALPGAEQQGDRIVVHDGMQPLEVRLARRRGELEAHVATRVPESPVALRVWPAGAAPPPMDADGLGVGGPPVERAARIEARLAGLLRVEASDEPHADAMLDAEVSGALLVVAREAAGSFCGLTYDGQRLTIHVRGAMASDPERATQVARTLWRPWVP